ncbi:MULTISPECIES: membrane protein YczE [Curtobacterium]|uniref:membrane protein YczE n=1 Tax=Curtobacterium flaccumfaciens TaxID=2035 RepID=UPI00310B4907
MPRTPALTLRFAQLAVGLFLYGASTALQVRAVVGVASWTVLTEGLEHVVPWSFGVITVVSSGVILLFWIPLRQKPGIGTLLNALAIGPSADLVLWLVPAPDGLLPRIGLFVAGLLLLAVATAFYIGAGFGAGARDGLMVGVSQRFGWPLWVARTVIEVTVVIVGWLLGGDVGAGTVIAAFAIGPMVQPLMPLFRRFPWSPERTRLATAAAAPPPPPSASGPGLEARVTS